MKEKLAINGGKKVREKDFGYIAPIGNEEFDAVTEVLKSKRLSGFYRDFRGGDRVQKFEDDFARYIGTKHAIAVNSGTSALHVAIGGFGIGPGDEVIVPPYTFTATASSILMNNAIPVFADIDSGTYCINTQKIRAAITRKTKAIIPVHMYGKVVDMDEIMAIAEEYGLKIIEDACQAPGCVYKKRRVGSIGHAGVFSFVETKNIVIGEGGMVTTDDDDVAQRCRLIRNHGEVWTKGKPRQYLSNLLGYNFRMTEIEAALGIEQLKKLEYLNSIRQKNAAFLEKGLKEFKAIKIPAYHDGEIAHVFPMLFDEKTAGISKERFMEAVNAEGVPLVPGYPHPLYKNPIFQEKIAYGDAGCPYACSFYGQEIDYKTVRCEAGEDICRRVMCLQQIHYPYGIEDMKDIVKVFSKVFNNLEELK